MDLVFRSIQGPDSPPPGPSEIYVQPASVDFQQRRDLAALVFEYGVGGLRQGAGEIDRVVVNIDATTRTSTLDDLLAAAFAMELLSGRSLPTGAKTFAQYAALVREGHVPSKLPLESSLEGLYLAVCNADGGDLAKPEVAERFAGCWQQVAEAILSAARDGLNPFSMPLVGEGSEFAREQMFLARDREVYQQDVKQGEQWTVSIPAPRRTAGRCCSEGQKACYSSNGAAARNTPGPAKRSSSWRWIGARAIGSSRPIRCCAYRSSRWPTCCKRRNPQSMPGPRQKILGSMASHSAIRSLPPRAAEPSFPSPIYWRSFIVGRTRRASDARPSTGDERAWQPPRPACCLARLVVFSRARVDEYPAGAEPPLRGPQSMEFLTVSQETIDEKVQQQRTGSDYAIFVATDEYDHWPKLHNTVRDARSIADVLQSHYGFEPNHIQPCFDRSKDQVTGALKSYFSDKFRFKPDDQLLIYIAGHGDRDPTTMKGYLVAKDSLLADDDASPAAKVKAENSCIDLASLKDDVEKLHVKADGCRHVFLIMDICFGDMIDFNEATKVSRSRGLPQVKDKLIPVPKDEIVRRIMDRSCCMFLTSVGADQPAADGTIHSPFAQRLIDLLSRPPADGLITMPNILLAVRSTQDPCHGSLQGHDSDGDFVFIWRH